MRVSYKAYLRFESEFDHHYACWANNHRGWSKMKKANRKNAKVKLNREFRKEISEYY